MQLLVRQTVRESESLTNEFENDDFAFDFLPQLRLLHLLFRRCATAMLFAMRRAFLFPNQVFFVDDLERHFELREAVRSKTDRTRAATPEHRTEHEGTDELLLAIRGTGGILQMHQWLLLLTRSGRGGVRHR